MNEKVLSGRGFFFFKMGNVFFSSVVRVEEDSVGGI